MSKTTALKYLVTTVGLGALVLTSAAVFAVGYQAITDSEDEETSPDEA